MYDALYTSGIPAGAEMAAWYPYDTRNPDGPPKGARQVVTIDNTGTHTDCDILDVESGAAWPPSVVPGWIRACTAPQPTVYCSLSNAPQVVSAMAGVNRAWDMWVADWTGSPHVPAVSGATVIGCQYQNTSSYDLSTITNDNWYPLREDVASVQVQNGWKWCEKCSGLFFPSSGGGNVCPAGGQHTADPSLDYAMPYAGS
jgi:hypothetical protein